MRSLGRGQVFRMVVHPGIPSDVVDLLRFKEPVGSAAAMRITVLGAGAWGTALAQLICSGHHQTILWSRNPTQTESLRLSRRNVDYLPDVPLDEELEFTSDLEHALAQAELIVFVVPSQSLRGLLTLARPHLRPGVGLVCAMKGIEADSLQLMNGVISSVLELGDDSGGRTHPLGVLSGPSFAKEVGLKIPTNLVAASDDEEFAKKLQQEFSTDWLRVYSSTDPVGVEVCGALKNVIAIAAGACDGIGFGQNTRAAVITLGIAEMSRLVVKLGGEASTCAGLAGVGDLVLTCTGELSRNRMLGHKLGAGVSLQDALSSSAGVAEGYVTAQSIHHLAQQLEVDLPICEAVYSVLHQDMSLKTALEGLFSRPLRPE